MQFEKAGDMTCVAPPSGPLLQKMAKDRFCTIHRLPRPNEIFSKTCDIASTGCNRTDTTASIIILIEKE